MAPNSNVMGVVFVCVMSYRILKDVLTHANVKFTGIKVCKEFLHDSANNGSDNGFQYAHFGGKVSPNSKNLKL